VFMTWQRNKEWKDNDTLYSTADGIDGNVLLVNAGNIYANKKNYNEAEKRYRRAIEIRDNSVLAHHNLGLIFLLKGNPDSAEIKFKKGISIDSLAPDGYFMLSNLYQQQGRIPEAIAQLEKLQTFSPDYRGTLQTLAMLKSKEIIPDSTTNIQYPEGIQLSARIQLLEKSSFANYQNGKYEQAIIEIKQLMKLNPSGTSGFYNNLALCYEGLGKNEDAEKSYLEALKTDPKNTSSMNGLSGIYLKKGNKAKGIEYLKKILELNPTDQAVRKRLDSLAG
jgi:tetratricopeptide (TPR) repeat protein